MAMQHRQLALEFPATWGGKRKGAGRKRRGARSCTPHRTRPAHRAGEPVHVTLRSALGPLRSQFLFPTVRLAIQRANRRAPDSFRIVEFSVQRDHLHLLVEASGRAELSSGLRGLSIRVARYVNDLLKRRGRFWADRWFGRALGSPRQVRNALVYVLNNFRKHGRDAGTAGGAGIDPYSSGGWFTGWREWQPSTGLPPPYALRLLAGVATDPTGVVPGREPLERASLPARNWLTTTGWRRYGLISIAARPR